MRESQGEMLRIPLGAVLGAAVAFLAFAALRGGASGRFEVALAGWSGLWSRSFLLVVLGGLASTVFGGYLAGVVARQRGRAAGALSAIPTAGFWGITAYLLWESKWVFLENSTGATILALLSIPCAIAAGHAGGRAGESFASHFDMRRHSFLGIGWYHYFWAPLVLGAILMQTGWALSRAGGLFASLGVVATLWLTGKGVSGAYLILSGLKPLPTVKRRILGVLKLGFACPLLAAVLQIVILGERAFRAY
ncbi:MAG: hypothetical protein JSV16_05640 [Candidatus Hydrogenedentota bacterium]|nr:MAG: hypothetical protein JSV16_05640 [Candidatus Hydrogenedentota bacterium]